jgi:hypothetical protein
MRAIDTALERIEGDEESHFTQIDDGMMFRVFGKHGHQNDEYYNALFSSAITSNTKTVHAGVKVWTPSGGFAVEEKESSSDDGSGSNASDLGDINAVPLAVYSDSDEVRGLKRKLLDATAYGAMYKKKLEEYQSAGVAGGELSDLKIDIEMYKEQIKLCIKERDAAKHDASEHAWRHTEALDMKANAVWFLRCEQEKTAKLEREIDDLRKALAKK